MSTARVSARTLAATLAVASVLGAAGCQRSLFRTGDNRTQFEAYEAMRQHRVDPVEPDVFGNPRPALRERLSRQ